MRRIALAMLLVFAAGCAAHDPAAVVTGPELGALSTARHVVRITQSADGPRYTIETKDGEVIAAERTWDELRAEHPTIVDALDGATARPLDASVFGLDR